jgi:DNA-binding XRE family transcriptional regulator
MASTSKFNNLRDELYREHPEARSEVEEKTHALLDAIRLAGIREELGVTQAQLASLLEVGQTNISRIEHEEDIYLSTLKKYVAALGGSLELSAVFPDRKITLMGEHPSTSTTPSGRLRRRPA